MLKRNLTYLSVAGVFIVSGMPLFAHGQARNPNRVHQLKSLKVAKLQASGHSIDAWIMDNELKRQEGMMFLKDGEVKANQGMIFAFEQLQGPSDGFWMHNTYIPLDIIYISAGKKVINIKYGKPFDETSLKPGSPYKFVVELKGGMAKKFGIKNGTIFSIPNSVIPID